MLRMQVGANMETSRRSLLIGLTGLICAPAIVRAASLMKVKAYEAPQYWMGQSGFYSFGLAQLKMEGEPALFDPGYTTHAKDWKRFVDDVAWQALNPETRPLVT